MNNPKTHAPHHTYEAILARIHGHARFITWFKRGLFVISIGLFLALIIWPLLNPVHEGLELKFSSLKQGKEGVTQMIKPMITGLDNQNHPYTIQAKRAIQIDKNTVKLEEIEGNFERGQEEWINVIAPYGYVMIDQNLAELEGGVMILTNDGYELRTRKVSIKFDENRIFSKTSLEGQGPLGILYANGFGINGTKKRLRFKGPVKLVIYP